MRGGNNNISCRISHQIMVELWKKVIFFFSPPLLALLYSRYNNTLMHGRNGIVERRGMANMLFFSEKDIFTAKSYTI